MFASTEYSGELDWLGFGFRANWWDCNCNSETNIGFALFYRGGKGHVQKSRDLQYFPNTAQYLQVKLHDMVSPIRDYLCFSLSLDLCTSHSLHNVQLAPLEDFLGKCVSPRATYLASLTISCWRLNLHSLCKKILVSGTTPITS